MASKFTDATDFDGVITGTLGKMSQSGGDDQRYYRLDLGEGHFKLSVLPDLIRVDYGSDGTQLVAETMLTGARVYEYVYTMVDGVFDAEEYRPRQSFDLVRDDIASSNPDARDITFLTHEYDFFGERREESTDGSTVTVYTGMYFLEVSGVAYPAQIATTDSSYSQVFTPTAGRFLVTVGDPTGVRSDTWGGWIEKVPFIVGGVVEDPDDDDDDDDGGDPTGSSETYYGNNPPDEALWNTLDPRRLSSNEYYGHADGSFDVEPYEGDGGGSGGGNWFDGRNLRDKIYHLFNTVKEPIKDVIREGIDKVIDELSKDNPNGTFFINAQEYQKDSIENAKQNMEGMDKLYQNSGGSSERIEDANSRANEIRERAIEMSIEHGPGIPGASLQDFLGPSLHFSELAPTEGHTDGMIAYAYRYDYGPVSGGSGRDVFIGMQKSNTFVTNGGADTIIMGDGRDYVVADKVSGIAVQSGAGLDTVTYRTTNYADVQIDNVDREVTVWSDSDWDELRGVDRLVFADGTLYLDTKPTEAAGTAYRLYQAAFARTPDSEGLSYWIKSVDNGTQYKYLADAFLASNEFTQKYGSNLTNEQYVSRLYNNVLDREGEPGGFNAWVNALKTGAVDRAQVLIGFSESAENAGLTNPAIQEGIWLV